MNPITWFESVMARVEDHINISNEIQRLVSEAKQERDIIMANLDKITVAVADLEAKVAAFVVPAVEDVTAEADALADRVEKATSDLEAKVPASATPAAPVDTTVTPAS